jgi:hypothetical protein
LEADSSYITGEVLTLLSGETTAKARQLHFEDTAGQKRRPCRPST